MERKRSLQRLSLEALAIFLGVSGGFLADDYRDYRNDRQEELEILAEMLDDLALDSADLAPVLQKSVSRLQRMTWLINEARQPGVSNESIVAVLDAQAADRFLSFEAVSFTYSSLRSTGGLGLIRDRRLRRAIVLYFEDFQPVTKERNRRAIDAELEWWDRLSEYVDFAPVDDLRTYPSVRDVDHRALLNDANVRWATVALGNWSENEAGLIGSMLEMNHELAEQIRVVIGPT